MIDVEFIQISMPELDAHEKADNVMREGVTLIIVDCPWTVPNCRRGTNVRYHHDPRAEALRLGKRGDVRSQGCAPRRFKQRATRSVNL